MAEYKDITSLLNKVDNEEARQEIETSSVPEEEYLSAEEFVNKIVQPIIDLQEADKQSVKRIVRGSTVYAPVNGVLTLPGEEASVSIVAQESKESYIETSGKVVLHVRITSVDGGEDTGNMVSVEIQRFANNNYTTVRTVQMQSRPMSSDGWDELDITDILADGDNQIRLVATDTDTLAVGRLAFASIVKASLSVEPMFDWSRPVTELSEGIPLSYAVMGTGVDKTLNIRIYDNNQDKYRDFTYFIGKNTYPITNPYVLPSNPKDNATDAVKIMSHGVHTVEAWVSCDANGNTYASPHIKSQIMVVADESDTKTYLMLQQTKGISDATAYFHADNYVQDDEFFAFAVYNPVGSAVNVIFSVNNYTNENNYMRMEMAANNSTKYIVPATIQIEDAVVGEESFAYLSATDNDGNNLLSISGDRAIILVANKYNFAPTAGADFQIKPSNRNNSEAHPDRILNAAKRDAVVESTFEGFNFDANDGWIMAEDGQRVLRVRAGQRLTIEYDIFDDFRNNPNSNVTIEFDIKSRNVTDEKTPVINISNKVEASGMFVGIQLSPMEGCVMTTSQTTYGQQNFGWREDRRTHIAINICSALFVDSVSRQTIPLIRVFVNGNPYREFMFALDNAEFGRQKTSIVIGQDAAEIDIYSVAVYRKYLSAQDIMQDYKSALPTSEEKLAFADANDILDANGNISYDRAREKYSCIVHHGRPASLQHPESTTCWLEISHIVNGKYDADTSGTICKETKMCPVKGQGSTAKHYADWNQQYDPKKAKLPDDDTTTPFIEKVSDGKTTRLPAIMVDGVLKQDGWIDGNGKYKGTYYQLSKSDAKAEKLVGKINYASSMQSHKMGATAAYNDLYRKVMGESLDTIMKENATARCAVKEDMFLFFVQETDSDMPRFEGIMTFGAGKMDKKTWGYDADKYPGFAMFEGSDNDQPVTNFERPWNGDVTYNPEEEYYEYNGKGNIDFDAGATVKETIDGKIKEFPTGFAVDMMKRFINFGYLYCTDLLPWAKNGGTATSLIDAGDSGTDIHKQYWITTGDATAQRGDLFSWSPKHQSWVKAGINQETRNVFDENPDVAFSGNYEAVNEALILSIRQRFRANGNSVYNVRSKLFHSCFVEYLLAGSDNCAKNTYYVIDPVTGLINFHADDLDTIFKTDNVGWQTKPYYVDRVHHIDDEGNETYSGVHNMFFNTFDREYEDDKRAMMNDIFKAMASIAGGVDGFFDKYFFNIQRTIPAIAYIEQARVRYERRQVQVNAGEITLDTVAPITQQLGSQLESELQYMDRRLIYFKSFAAYGEFSVGGGGNNFGFRGYPKRDNTGAKISFTVKPHQYIYPAGAYGQTLIDPHVRLSPSDNYELVLEKSCSSDTTCSLFGIDYYTEIGNIGELSVNPSYAIALGGKRLTTVEAYPEGSEEGEFRPSQLSITAALVESVRINVKDIGSNLNLTQLTRLESVDVRGTSLNRVNFPSTQTLRTVNLGDNINSIILAGLPNLAVFTIGNCQYLSEFQIGKNVSQEVDSMSIVQKAFLDGASLQYISVENIKWGDEALSTGLTARALEWLSNADYAHITGVINVVGTLDAQSKQALMRKFGNIDSPANPLYITYRKINVNGLAIQGPTQIPKPGAYQFSLITTPSNANSFVSIEWSMNSSTYATIDQNGMLNVTSVADEDIEQPIAQIQCKLTNADGSTLTATYRAYLFNRKPRVGDYAYADGTFDSELHVGKAVAGWVFKVDNETYNGKPALRCLVQAAEERVRIATSALSLDSLPWGLREGTSGPGDAVLDEIAKGTDLGSRTNVVDIPAIGNITANGLINESGTGTQDTVRHYNAYDMNQPDGFALISEISGQGDMNGYSNTRLIINHADKILNWAAENLSNSNHERLTDYLPSGNVKPTNLQELGDLMYALQTLGGSANFRQLCYPAAYACHVYEPKTERLHQQYKSGNWYLPAEGELVRLYIFHRNSKTQNPTESSTTADTRSYYPDAKYANDNPAKESLLPAYANFLKKARDKNVISPIANNVQVTHWSATEASSYSWVVNFSNGAANEIGSAKGNSYVVRPVVAFHFEL